MSIFLCVQSVFLHKNGNETGLLLCRHSPWPECHTFYDLKKQGVNLDYI